MSKWNDLTSPRLRLRCLLLEDAPAICAYRSLPEVARYQSREGYTLAEAERLVEEQRDMAPDTPDSWLPLAIVEMESGTLIGDCGLHFLDDDGQQVEVELFLRPLTKGGDWRARP